MKEYQDLNIRIERGQFDSFTEYLSQIAPSTWKLNIARAQNIPIPNDSVMYCFDYFENEEHIASLWLADHESGGLYVSNIVPAKVSSLSVPEYNNILKFFGEQMLSNASAEFGASIEFSKEDIELTDIFSAAAADSLLSFSNLANKSTGHSHPCDRKRWFSFISHAFNSSKRAYPDQLEKLLVELGWDESSASDLSRDYEYSLELLKSVN
ncbi:hypothetical protein [Pseudoalteromonas sp. Of7M-16]|uniref:hypothetical protein n=1 Tax=Pseudoalteromonas sp. Of7M-16 TaxID=2917756 RepID=UPI001EF571D3|nr:hypothetical protein [Pseudoalteromonas sp. Of7M-16]MCG7549201.1 hypothetical protein [Pseudoalteromonas sp. Of7M-16]